MATFEAVKAVWETGEDLGGGVHRCTPTSGDMAELGELYILIEGDKCAVARARKGAWEGEFGEAGRELILKCLRESIDESL